MYHWKKTKKKLALALLAALILCGCNPSAASASDPAQDSVEATKETEENTPYVSENSAAQRGGAAGIETEREEESGGGSQSQDGIPSAGEQREAENPVEAETKGTEAEGADRWTLQECRELFDSLDPAVWSLYWNIYESELRTFLTEEDFCELQSYVKAGEEESRTEISEISVSDSDREAAQEAFRLQNEKRTEAGLAELNWSEEIYELAVKRLSQLAVSFSHEGCPQGYGENLASGASGDSLQVIERWYASEDHRLNMLDENYTAGAIACANGLWAALFW